ncbi:MAG: MBL fold metallo-hydrolase [Methanobacteriota archaeon]
MTTVTFIGTSGGRFATITQMRGTGGVYIEDHIRIHVDPGPGALVSMVKMGLDPRLTDVIVVSHGHPDHYGDADVLVEAMTEGGTRHRGILIGSRSVTEGMGNYWPIISRYHLSKPAQVKTARVGDKYFLDGLNVEVHPSKHTDESTVGFRFNTLSGAISYVSDSEYSEELAMRHRGARLLILPATRPIQGRIPGHMCTEDIAEFVKIAKPELAVMTHFGLKVLKSGPEREAQWVREKTGMNVVAAEDGMQVRIDGKVEVLKERKKASADFRPGSERIALPPPLEDREGKPGGTYQP